MHPCVYCSIIHGDQWKQLRCLSIDDWRKKMGLRHTVNTTQPQKDEILPFATTWMDLENIMPSQVSQREKVENGMISLVRGTWNGKQRRSKQGKQTSKQKARPRRQCGGDQREGSSRGLWGSNVWGQRKMWLWVVGTQRNVQVMHPRIVHYKPI